MLKQVQHDSVEEISYIEPDFIDWWRDMQEKAVNMSPNANVVPIASGNTEDKNGNESPGDILCSSLIFLRRIAGNHVSFRTSFGISRLIQLNNLPGPLTETS